MTTYPTPVVQTIQALAQVMLGTWATGGRPATPAAGWTGFNTTLGVLEYYNGTSWVPSPGWLTTFDLAATAAGSSSADAYQIVAFRTIVTTAAANTGLITPNSSAGFQDWGTVRNAGANPFKLYPKSGTINGGASVIVPVGSTAIWQFQSSGVFFT